MNAKAILTKIGRKCKMSAPTILTVVSVGGVVGTAVMAVKATPKAVRIIDEKQIRSQEPLTKLEITKLCWKLYVPSVLIGTSTIACIMGANVLNQKQQASIASIYGLVDQSYKRYRTAACEVYGDDADMKINAQVAKDNFIYTGEYCSYYPDFEVGEKVLFYDIFSGRYFQSTMAAVVNAQYHINRMWVLQGEVTVNEFYTFLGIDKIAGGDDVGWTYEYAEDGMAWIDFDTTKVELEDDMECFTISTPFGPDPISWSMDEAFESYNRRDGAPMER